jgi:hypothetical protein
MFVTYFYLTQYPLPRVGIPITPLHPRVGIAINSYVVGMLLSNHLILGL